MPLLDQKINVTFSSFLRIKQTYLTIMMISMTLTINNISESGGDKAVDNIVSEFGDNAIGNIYNNYNVHLSNDDDNYLGSSGSIIDDSSTKEIKGQLKIDVEDDDITVTVNGDFFEIVLTFPEKIKTDESVKVQIDKEMVTLFFKKGRNK
ncbi:3149_t:CDS:2 [Entrophospora sp. SA101]|nr:3149_t:CDS:2 [Entrophospora sp. SA101]